MPRSQMTSLWLVLALCLSVEVSNALDKVMFDPKGNHNAPTGSRVAPKGNHGPPKGNHGAPNGTRVAPKGNHGAPDETHIAPKGAPSTSRGPSVSPKPKQVRPFFVFGDSLVDSGNNNHLMTGARADMPPYGIDSPNHQPTGRFSNGLNIPDIISEYIGSEPILPYLSPELTGQKLLVGANFASAGVGIRRDTGMLFGDVLKMPAQLQLFEEYQRKLSLVTDEKQAKQLVNQALVLVSLGGNDFINNYWRNPFMIKSLLTAVPDYVTNLISEYRKILEKMYDLGARRVIVMGPGPLGCAPGERMFHNTHGDCSPDLQAAASLFEPQLAQMVQDLNAEYHADVFIAANSYVMNGNRHGSRVLPPSMNPPMSVPTPQYGGAIELYRPAGVIDEQEVGDERLIYQTALQDLHQPVTEADLPKGVLTVSLLRHQKIALAWMVQKEQSSVACSGGILADDQGLGKTISMIALIQNQKSLSKPNHDSKAEAMNLDDDDGKETVVVDEDKDESKLITQPSSSAQKVSNRKPTAGSLVVCPASVLRQWARELDEKVTDEAKLEVLVYHGGNRTKDPAELASYDVVLTTYAIVAKEVPSKVFDEQDEDDQKNGDRYGLSSAFANKKKKGATSGKKKKGKKEIDGSIDCSGTLAKVNWFRVILDEAQTIKNSRTQVSKSCCGLRAKKRWCLSGTPIQNSIDEMFSYFRFLKCDPYASYKSFCNQIKIPISRNSMHGYRKLQAVLTAIMLRRTKGTVIDGKPIINLPKKTIKLTNVDFSPEERAFYLKLEAESRSRFKAYAAAGTVSQNYANILLMLLRLRQACDHPLLVKGFSSESVSRVSTRMAKTLPKDMLVNLLNLLDTLNICSLCSDPPEDAVVTLCGHVFCYQCVSDYLTGDDNICPSPKCKSPIGSDVVFNQATLRSSISDDNGANSSRINEKSIVLQQDYSSAKIKAVIEIIRSNCRSKSSYSECNGGSGNASSSSGIQGPIKAIVFSQWTRMLDLVEMSLNQYCLEYRRLDGSMSLASRDRAVKEFNTDPEVIVMLMSLKAGNLGLNMVAASHVILLDLWWNPTTEDQAIDRAHRIGQTRPVTVTRLTIKDTVEDRILALQEEKRKMVASAFGEDQSGTSTKGLTPEDLRFLFMGGH